MSVRARNLAIVEELLAGCPLPVRALEASEVLAAVDLDLVTPRQVIRVRIEPNRPDQPAFARAGSVAVSHLGGGAPMDAAAIQALRALARHLAARDRGAVLAAPERRGERRDHHVDGGAHERRDAPREGQPRVALRMVPATGADAAPGAGASPWSREIFDRNIDALAARGGPFLSAVLVVMQTCEMSCVFCPSGDLARAMPDDLEVDAHFADLLHQISRARTLGLDTLEIGGNDVLRFPRALDLFRAAGALGFRRISAQSPGQRLADEPFARALADTPLGHVDLPIYGATPATHETITRVPGSFDALCRAVDRALALGSPRVVLHTIALRSTLARLDDLLAFGRARFGLPIRVELLRPNRVGERDHLHDAASLPEIAAAASRHPDHFGGDVPLCAVPVPRARALFAERAPTNAFSRRVHLWDLGLRPHVEDLRATEDRRPEFPPTCADCSVRPACPGLLRAYLDLFGPPTLSPLPPP